jgi:hypothetical protein
VHARGGPTTPKDKSRELQRELYRAAKRNNLESRRKKVVGEPYEGKPHVRFEVAGDGNQDMVRVIEALSKETESKQAAWPKSQAPSPDPTSGRRFTPPLIGGVRLF